MNRTYYLMTYGLGLLVPLTIASVGLAAPVTWQTATELVSDADVDLSFGPLVYAVNGGDNTGNESVVSPAQPSTRIVTIGTTPVPFESVEGLYGDASSFGQIGFGSETFGDAIDHVSGDGSNVTFSTTDHRTVDIPQVTYDLASVPPAENLGTRKYDVGTGNVDLDVILASQVFVDSRAIGSGALNISLNNLNPGQAYRLQLFGPAADNGRISTAAVDDGLGNTAADLGGFLDLDQDGIFHVTTVIGDFVADASSQAINVLLADGRNTGISGLVLTTNIPEPTSVALVCIGLVTIAACRRNS